jgi:FkbM family methyltransferase
MNVLLELKKRFSPYGKHRLALSELKKLKEKYPTDPLLKETIRVVRKKIFSISGSKIVGRLRGQLIGLYLDELNIKRGTVSHLNNVNIKSYEYSNYEYILMYEYIDIVLSDLYFRQKIGNTSVLSGILSCLPQEGPYQWKNVCLNEGDVVIDAGSNIGLFSLFAAKYFHCQCYAFEPFTAILPTLEENIKMNALDNFIHICPYGLSNTNSVATFNIAHNNIGASSIVMKRDEISNNDINEIQCVSLDSWVKENNISKIDFIKADIEGAERLLLQGATHVLQTFQPKISICTYHLPDDRQVLENIIKKTNPKYKIMHIHEKLYAYVPEKYK